MDRGNCEDIKTIKKVSKILRPCNESTISFMNPMNINSGTMWIQICCRPLWLAQIGIVNPLRLRIQSKKQLGLI